MHVVNFYLTLVNLSHNYLICRVVKQPIPSPLFCFSAWALLFHKSSRCPGASCLFLLLVALHTYDGQEHVWESLLFGLGPIQVLSFHWQHQNFLFYTMHYVFLWIYSLCTHTNLTSWCYFWNHTRSNSPLGFSCIITVGQCAYKWGHGLAHCA